MMSGTPEAPEAKIRFLGKEVKPRDIGTGGFFLTMAGIWVGKVPCIALPAVIVGLGAMAYSIHKMEQQDRETPSK